MTAFAWAGVVLLGIISIIILIAAAGGLVDKFSGMLRIRDSKVEDLAVVRLGERILHDSWWFGENVQVMTFCQVLGKAISSSSHYSVENVRNEWRKRIRYEEERATKEKESELREGSEEASSRG